MRATRASEKKITIRQGQILAAIVREYSKDGIPVSSQELVERGYFQVSCATVRNDMQVLEKLGYITHPHTSAGRIPTDTGYRYFISKLMKHLELTHREQAKLQNELAKLKRQYIEMGRSLTSLLAEHSRGAAFALLPEGTVSTGLSNVIDSRISRAEIREVAKFLDELADHKDRFFSKAKAETQAFIGNDAPVPLSRDFSMVVKRVALPDGGQGVVGVIGPKRMKYDKNISLLDYVSKLLSSGLGTVLIINIM